jgi:hypothetical protein
MINSMDVERHRNQAVLTATIPTGLLQKMMSTPQDLKKMATPESANPSPTQSR